MIRFWRMKQSEDGQAIVIAAIGLLLIAFAVLGTATLGHAIHEKVKLQNAADAASYSIAAVEARAFNFYAFTNRVMASHYSAVMILQSYLAVAGFVISAVNTVLVVFLFLDKFCDSSCGKVVCNAVRALLPPPFNTLVELVQRIIHLVTQLLQGWQEWLDRLMWGDINLDRVVGTRAIPFFVGLNWMLYVAQIAMMATTTATVLGSGHQFVLANYEGDLPPRINFATATLMATLNLESWDRAHDPEGMNWRPKAIFDPNLGGGRTALSERLAWDMDTLSAGVKRAERVMGEIANATRWNNFVFNRSLEARRSLLDTLTSASAGFVRFETHGSTRLLTESYPNWRMSQRSNYSAHDMRPQTPNPGHSYIPQGGSLVGDQWVEVSLPFLDYDTTEHRIHVGWGMFSYNRKFTPDVRHSVVAASHRDYSPHNRSGWHCVTRLTPPNRSLCLVRTFGTCVCKVRRLRLIDVQRSACNYPEANEAPGGNHPWWGIVPFMKFNPEPDPSAGVDFHQPSTYTWLHQPPEHIDREPLLQRDVLGLGGHTATHDTGAGHNVEASPFMAPGFHAISRSQVYYHRPGNWREHPNFFNPYWRAKIAPMAPVLGGFLDRMGGGGFMDDNIVRRMVTH